MNNIKMLKLLKMLKQFISQLEQMCLKLGLKNGYTLTVSNFKRQFVPQKWPGTGKGVITDSSGHNHFWISVSSFVIG